MPKDIQDYFLHLPSLLNSNLPWDVIIAYQFIQVEKAQNRTIYGGVVKIHRAHKEVVGSMLYPLHITRASFLTLFETIFSEPLDKNTVNKLKLAEKVRDKTVHGKGVSVSEARQAIGDVLDYAHLMNIQVDKIAGFYPFGSMKGFKGRREPLEEKTTSWLLKGLLSTALDKKK